MPAATAVLRCTTFPSVQGGMAIAPAGAMPPPFPSAPGPCMTLSTAPDLLVFSHLRWGPAVDRPQQLMQLLAGAWRVWFVEEPVWTAGPPRLEARSLGPHLTLLVPHTPLPAAGFDAQQLALIRPLLRTWLSRHRVRDPAAWLSTPMALPWAQAVHPACIVYDCMEDLAGRPQAPAALPQLEVALLAEASIVLTGGPSLYQALRHLHPNVHCVPGSVDVEHFSPSRLRPGSPHDQAAASLQGSLRRPRLGCLDAVDERLDLDLLTQLADARPSWPIVMAGPIDPRLARALPERPNLHWLASQPYERLPYLLAGWDLCLMPCIVDASTRLLSPGSTLRYMAAERPVLSTAIADVIMLHGNAVTVADSAWSFIAACDRLLAEGAASRFARQREMLNTVSTTSWQRTAASVHHLVSAAHEVALRGRELRNLRPATPAPALRTAPRATRTVARP